MSEIIPFDPQSKPPTAPEKWLVAETGLVCRWILDTREQGAMPEDVYEALSKILAACQLLPVKPPDWFA